MGASGEPCPTLHSHLARKRVYLAIFLSEGLPVVCIAANQRGRFILVRLCGTFPTVRFLDRAAAAVSGFSACLARTFLKFFFAYVDLAVLRAARNTRGHKEPTYRTYFLLNVN